ncbi:two-component sensor histidine kinase, partial [Leptolyngbya sp. FACHB-711]|nr:two-component sensor histidine kinase [Leptolyngbya sp. FACHB-711]
MLGQSSFRRILLLRILLLSIPILFLGMAVTFRNARTSLLHTARLNLEQSAIRKADTLQSSIQSLQTTLSVTSQTAILKSGSPTTVQPFLTQVQSQLPSVRCLQLRDFSTQVLVASTCGNRVLDFVPSKNWSPKRSPAEANQFSPFSIVPNRLN